MYLGLDLGTTNVKAAVVDWQGHILARGAVPIQLFHTPDGGVEQDLEETWQATLAAIRQTSQSICLSAISAIGISSQGGAMQILDAQFNPLGRVISWLDARGRLDDDALTAELGRNWFLQRISHGRSGLAIGQLLRLRREAPDLLREPNRVGFVGDCLVHRLCDRAAHDGTSCGLTLLYDPSHETTAGELLARLGIAPAQLPDLISPRCAAGGLSARVAAQTGLPPNIPVSAAVHDQYAATLGASAVHPGDVMFGAGTAWVLLAVTDHLPKPVIDEAFVCTHVVDGLYGQIVSLYNGGSALTWTINLLGLAEKPRAEIERLMVSTPPGCDGVRCWPFFAGYDAPGLAPNTRARFSGLQFAHTPGHFLRAVVEGLAFELQRHLLLFRRAQLPVARLIMCGGAAASQLTPQIIADVTGLPVVCLSDSEASLLGAAIIARGLIEAERPLPDLVVEMAPAGRRLEASPNAAFYQEQFTAYERSLPPARYGPK